LEVLEPLKRALERIHRERDITIRIACPPSVRFGGERQDLEEILGNLCDNACKWAKREVSVRVAVDGRRTPARIEVTVEDDGPGLPDGERARIGKRGVKLDETKPGSGLGLSIVTDLVQSYRGRLTLGRAAMGGLSVRLDLPSA